MKEYYRNGELQRAETLAHDLLMRADLPILYRARLHLILATYENESLWHAEQAVLYFTQTIARSQAAIERGDRVRGERDEILDSDLALAKEMVQDAENEKAEAEGAEEMNEQEEEEGEHKEGEDELEGEEEMGQRSPTNLLQDVSEEETPLPAPSGQRRRRGTALPTPAPTSGPAAPSSPQTEHEDRRTLASTRARRLSRAPDRYGA